MNEKTISEEMIIQYLLNDLKDADEAHFEEAYLRDGSLFDQILAIEEELIEDYVRGELTEYERQRFELHYLANQARRARVEAARQLVRLCSAPAPKSLAGRKFSLRSQLQSLWGRPLIPSFALAIALLLVLGAFLANQVLQLRRRLGAVTEERAALVRQSDELEKRRSDESGRQTEEQTRNIADRRDQAKRETRQVRRAGARIALLMLLPSTREIGRPNEVSISPQTTLVEIRIPLESNHDRYRASVQTAEGNKVIWSEEGIRPRRKGNNLYVLARVPVDRFRESGENEFRLSLTGSAPNEIPDLYFFQVTYR